MKHLQRQKFLILFVICFTNALLIGTFIPFEKYWYVYLIFLALSSMFNSFGSIYLWWKTFFKKKESIDSLETITPANFVYVVPCYNETEEELRNTIDSLKAQKNVDKNQKLMIVICDGKVMSEDGMSTDKILVKKIFKNDISFQCIFLEAYKTWDESWNTVDFYYGRVSYDLPFMLIVKHKNVGKRDSLVLVRRLLYSFVYLKEDLSLISPSFLVQVSSCLHNLFPSFHIDYLIGTDADTVFEENCAAKLVRVMDEGDKDVVGCVGFVKPEITEKNKYSLFNLYQNAEYIFAQCLKRRVQSLLTHKVSCLSGCVQIIKICTEMCGEEVLKQFNYLPKEEENIFNHIRSYASEDRNHIGIAQSLYKDIKTLQCLDAVAFTKVPNKVRVFLSQRRRWSLGATLNDLLLTYRPNIYMIERVNAFINIFTFCIFPFIVCAQIFFVKTIFFNHSMLLLYLCIPMLIPFVYGFSIPYLIDMKISETLYFLFGFLFYTLFGFVINTVVSSYALLNMDVIAWGKTRKVVLQRDEEVERKILESWV